MCVRFCVRWLLNYFKKFTFKICAQVCVNMSVNNLHKRNSFCFYRKQVVVNKYQIILFINLGVVRCIINKNLKFIRI